MHQREHRGVRAQTNGERQHDNAGKPGLLAQPAKGKAKVLAFASRNEESVAATILGSR